MKVGRRLEYFLTDLAYVRKDLSSQFEDLCPAKIRQRLLEFRLVDEVIREGNIHHLVVAH